MSGIAVGERWLVYCILNNNYEVAFALVFLCAGAHKLVSAFLLEVINSCIILAREFCVCCALNTLKVPTRYRHGYRLRDNGEPALMGAFCGGGIGRADLRDPAKRRGEVGNANSYQFLRTKTLILPPSNFFLLFTMTTSSVDNGSLLYYCTYFVGACAYLFATYRSIVINKVEEYKWIFKVFTWWVP